LQNLNVTIEIPAGVLNLSQELQSPIEDVSDAATHYLSDAYKFYVVEVGAVDSGELLFSIHVEEGASGGDYHRKYVRAGAAHAMVVEVGWTERGQGQASYPGRFPAQKAVESLLEGLQSGRVVDALAWRLGK
jgi:hypothetical protein